MKKLFCDWCDHEIGFGRPSKLDGVKAYIKPPGSKDLFMVASSTFPVNGVVPDICELCCARYIAHVKAFVPPNAKPEDRPKAAPMFDPPDDEERITKLSHVAMDAFFAQDHSADEEVIWHGVGKAIYDALDL